MNIHLEENGQAVGPYSQEQVRAMLASGQISASALAWAEGTSEWRPLNQIIPLGAPPPSYQPMSLAAAGAYRPANISTTVLADRGTRFGAFLLDRLLMVLSIAPGFVMIIMGGDKEHPDKVLAGCGVLLIAILFLTLMAVQISMLTTRGQSIAKRVVGIKIVKFSDESNPGFVKAFFLRGFLVGLMSSVPSLGSIFRIVDACFIFRDDRRCLHDL
ncbi:MAG TPA: RDD family protein, partial [Chthoniobacteraceae bacterium]|nr:RDD family protein [Chthoniobacteraceae bacterium]